MKTTVILFIGFLSVFTSHGQSTSVQNPISNITKVGDFIIEPSTLRCAGFEWKIYGDENRNASVEVRYRKKGTTEWKEASLVADWRRTNLWTRPTLGVHNNPYVRR